MALSALLKFGDPDNGLYHKIYMVRSAKLFFNRQHSGVLPDSDCRCSKIVVELDAPEKDDLWLYEWYSVREVVSGTVEMEEPSLQHETTSRTVVFRDAVCSSIKETYDIRENRQLRMTVEFVARTVITDEVSVSYYPEF
ncbi:MAG: hypothetical protein MJY45_06150 [Bacteroidales bacterium]|nr:hypothetical protein [Bacteroidales bacterium]